MIKDLELPDLGEGIDGAEISEIPVTVGDEITKDQTILILESDKASMEIPSDFTGTLKEILVSTGDEVATGQLLMKIDSSDESTDQEKKEDETDKTTDSTESKSEVEDSNLGNTAPIQAPKLDLNLSNDGIFASPGVRRLARELQINLSHINGTGEKNRITKDDLNNYILRQMASSSGSSIPTPIVQEDFSQWGETENQKLTKIKRITGKRLQAAWQTIPHVTQFDEADITDLDTYRKKLKEKLLKDGIKVTFLPFLIKALTHVLKEMPEFNSSLDSSSTNLVIKKYINIGIAVDTPTGLVVPVISNADQKSISDLSIELVDISNRARNKKLKPAELKGGTFTISSLGGIGGSFFTPIINPPEVAIIGVSQSLWKNIFNRNEKKSELKYIMPFSLSYDHRIIDGAAGARFTKRFKEILDDLSFFKD
jgi:pyruvate dehydrogenase E2 component (dihydrolipoamide acetyltransferase)